jgi:predicted nucleic acid-binding protein
MIADGLLDVIYNRRILDEYKHVLARPHFGFPDNLIADALDLFLMRGIPIEAKVSEIPMIDESDRVFYDTAVTCAAILITGNLKHYPQEPYVIKPADFLSI